MLPRWKETLLIYTYDEHGGYYEDVRALLPDATLRASSPLETDLIHEPSQAHVTVAPTEHVLPRAQNECVAPLNQPNCGASAANNLN
jgi:hypothetical protein